MRRGHSQIFYLNVRRPGQWLRLWRALRSVPFDLLYVNSLWNPAFTVVAILAVRFRLIHAQRILLAPRGELSAGALSLKARKKSLFLRWWAPLLRSVNVAWHAASDQEVEEIRAFFPWADITVNQPQVSFRAEPLPPAMVAEGPARLVFIGRISPKKGLDVALTALRSLFEPVVFDIYGPLEDARYWSRCRSLIRQLPTYVQATYRGELASADVRRTFSRYDAFLFPTRGENFGHVIAESLSASCPVFCSDQTPWTEVLDAGGGFVVRNLTATELGLQLRRFVGFTPAERLAVRQAACRAYSSWRQRSVAPNIIDEARLIYSMSSN